MKTAIEKILTAHGLLESFNSNEDYSVKISNEPFMPLSVEKHGSQVIVAHYFEQNGDLVPDPDMEFEMINNEWSPVAIQHATGHYFCAVEYHDGERRANPAQLRDQRSFARTWARNLITQGFSKGKVISSEIC